MRHLLLALLILPFTVLGQTDLVPGILILKVRPEHKEAVQRQGIQWETLQGTGALSVTQMFPRAEDPKGRTDRFGNPLVDISRIFKVQLPEQADLGEWTEKLASSGRFDWVEPTTWSISFSTPNDPQIGSQNHLTQIGAFAAWEVTQGDTNVVIGVTDTSFDLLHQDLQGNLKRNYDDLVDGLDNDNDGFIDNFAGWDVVDDDNTLFVANNYHGTGVLAVVSATTDNGVGIAGVGYNCKYLPVKIGNNSGSIVTADGYESITYCADRDCKVINCSWGTVTFSNLGQDVVNYATINKDAVVVASAGNNAVEEYRYPASFDNAISVTGVHNNDVFNNGTNPTFTWSDKVDMCAQGFNVFSTATLGGSPGASPVYTTTGGTSYAAPQVSGAAALVRSQFPCLTAIETTDLLLANAVDIESVGTNSNYAGKIGKRLDMAAPLSIAIDPCEPVGTDNVTVRQQVVVYPNPSNSEVTVRTPFHGDWQLSVMDAQGRAVRNDAFVGQEQTLRGLPSGMYTIAVSNGQYRSVQRIVVSGH
jgi:serine protease